MRILRRELRRFRVLLRGAIVIKLGLIENGLRNSRAQVEIVIRADDGWKGGAAGDVEMEARKSQRRQIRLLIHSGERSIDLRQQIAARNGSLSVSLTQALLEPHRSQVRFDAAGNRVVERNRRAAAPGVRDVGTLPW